MDSTTQAGFATVSGYYPPADTDFGADYTWYDAVQVRGLARRVEWRKRMSCWPMGGRQRAMGGECGSLYSSIHTCGPSIRFVRFVTNACPDGLSRMPPSLPPSLPQAYAGVNFQGSMMSQPDFHVSTHRDAPAPPSHPLLRRMPT